ncbi:MULTISPECIES: DUF488 family protein [unclassified Curtobacterium]|uniref:DUF488 domain-containing protein n=1 Tax=unclassified Curtobacterium TaxID=257496 RepID=UPI0008DE5296|nr:MULTISPECIES: DUF488 domain-containing protein [unclassified Curtobacterium]OIH99870.1 hypothetical protein BIU92_03130 [Curtobacterium sp. MCBA15_003]OII32716.1 hypothetical protein BIU94_16390 [Curtobacterium sp. MMLR14_006]
MAPRAIIGIGYEGSDLEGLVARLRLRGVEHVVDVRLNPISRKRGLSKTALRAGLEAAGIGYSHLRALGNPKTNREGFATSAGPEAFASRETYRDLLRSDEAQSALSEVRDLTESHHVALLCFEADETHCHRELILQALCAEDLALAV